MKKSETLGPIGSSKHLNMWQKTTACATYLTRHNGVSNVFYTKNIGNLYHKLFMKNYVKDIVGLVSGKRENGTSYWNTSNGNEVPYKPDRSKLSTIQTCDSSAVHIIEGSFRLVF